MQILIFHTELHALNPCSLLGWEMSWISLLSFKYKQKQQFINEMSLQILEYVAPSSGHIK